MVTSGTAPSSQKPWQRYGARGPVGGPVRRSRMRIAASTASLPMAVSKVAREAFSSWISVFTRPPIGVP